jgi:hypothetical protein
LQSKITNKNNDIIHSLKPEACGQCHRSQFQEWKKSLHASAAREGLIGQLILFDDATVKFCLDCHAPRTEQQLKILKGSNENIHGVDCASCHVRKMVRYGKRSIDITPHGRVNKNKLFNSSLFCSSCHQFNDDGIKINGKPLENTFQEWSESDYPAKQKTCQSCHMPNGSHKFEGIHSPAMVRSALIIKAKRVNKRLEVTVHNKAAGHALPTYITPRIRLVWLTDDKKSMTIASIQRKMSWSIEGGWVEISDTRLQAHEIRTISTTLPNNLAGWLEVWVDPDADYYDRVYPAIIKSLKEEQHNTKAMQQILKARKRSGLSTYLLLRLRCEMRTSYECQ